MGYVLFRPNNLMQSTVIGLVPENTRLKWAEFPLRTDVEEGTSNDETTTEIQTFVQKTIKVSFS